MKIKINKFTDELKLQVVQKYLSTSQSQEELKLKYGIRGKNCLNNWMQKFGLKAPGQNQIDNLRIMAKESDKTARERDLEIKIAKLEKEMDHNKLRILALNTMIDIAERDLNIPIRKKSGTKR